MKKRWKILIYLLLIFLLIIILERCSNYTKEIPVTAQPSILEGSDSTAVLLIHGFGASPWEMQGLASFLNTKNLTVHNLLLPGHTTYNDFKSTSWQEWYSAVEEAYLTLSKTYENIIVGGLSLGGTLSLLLAESYPVDGVVSINSAVYLMDKKALLSPVIKFFIPYVKMNLTEEEIGHYQNKRPLAAVHQLLKAAKACKSNLKSINSPVLILQSSSDTTVNPKSAEFIYSRIVSEKKLIYYNESNHVLVKSKSKNRVFNDIYNFITETLANKP